MKGFNLLAVAATATCLAGVVHANTVTYTGTFSGGTDVTNQAIAVSQFNPTLGTLQSASFTLYASMNTNAFASNDGNFFVGWDKLTYTLDLTGNAMGVSASDLATRIVGTGSPDGNFGVGKWLNVVTNTNPSYWTQNGPTLTANQTFVQAAQASFIGNGHLDFLLNTVNQDVLSVAGTQTGGLPPSSFGNNTNVAANVAVTYTYAEAIPEPETYAILLAGLGMLGLWKRRQTKQQ